MSIGPATLVAIIASVLATLVWFLVTTFIPTRNNWLAMFLFGVFLLLVYSVGPLIKLP